MNVILSEIKKLKHSKVLFILFFVIVAFIVYAQYDAAEIGITSAGYIVSTSLAILNFFGVMLSYVMGAMVFYNDYTWNTIGWLLTGNKSRSKIALTKIVTIFLINAGLELVVLLFAITIHLITGKTAVKLIPNQFLPQVIVTFLNLIIWGLLAFTLTTVTKSIILGILIPFVITSFEMLVYSYLNQVILRFLLNYNIRALIVTCFSNLKSGSLIVFPDIGYNGSLISHICFLFFVMTALIVTAVLSFKHKEVTS